jgi:RHH-type rel operon transcriptional repressor/antitoxin RelB
MQFLGDIMINVRVPELEERLDKLAELTGRTKSYYVKQALQAFLDEQEEAQLALKRLQDKLLIVYVLTVGHRKDIYKN